MSTALALALLALADCILCGFRVAAGRNGRLHKRAYYMKSLLRAAVWGVALVLANVGVTTLVCAVSGDAASAWAAFVDAGRRLVAVYAVFATMTLAAFGFYFAPSCDVRVLANVVVFGPLTLVRRAVIVCGLVYAVVSVPRAGVVLVAVCAGASMCSFEALLGRRYSDEWRAVVDQRPR